MRRARACSAGSRSRTASARRSNRKRKSISSRVRRRARARSPRGVRLARRRPAIARSARAAWLGRALHCRSRRRPAGRGGASWSAMSRWPQATHSVTGAAASPGERARSSAPDALPNARRRRERLRPAPPAVTLRQHPAGPPPAPAAAAASARRAFGAASASAADSVVRRSCAIGTPSSSARQTRPSHHRVVGDRQARLPQRDQVAGQVAAVHRGDVRRLEHAQVVQVVPVVEVSAEAPHPLERAERQLQPSRISSTVMKPRSHALDRREQLEADVGRRRAHRDDRRRILLEVVRREPVRLGGDEAVEEAPVEERVAQRAASARRPAIRRSRARPPGALERVRDRRRQRSTAR